MAHRGRRWLFIVHRWVGIVTCLFFATWFVSGLVMIYVPFPSLAQAERLAGLPAIDWRQVAIQPAALLGPTAPPRTMTLEMREPVAVWRMTAWDGAQRIVSARDGRVLGPADAAEARRIAEDFGQAPVRAMEQVARDQWTVAGGFDKHRPLWKASLAGPGGRMLYVSSRTGAVVLDTAMEERFWNWLGSVPHWIYPTVLRQDNAAWRQVVMWTSGTCIVAAITGFWIGVLRLRPGRRRFRSGRMTAYSGWMKWHHVAGLTGGIFLIAFIISGWLSVDPFRMFESGGVSQAARIAYLKAGPLPAIDLAALARRAASAKQIELAWYAGRPILLVRRATGAEAVLGPTTLTRARIDERALILAASRLVPGVPLAGVERLTAPDYHWYAVHGPTRLPILRLRFADAAATWVHIDPTTGQIMDDIDRRRRLYRTVFDLLHRWDLNALILHRPARDLLLWTLSLLGLVTSSSGIVVGWRRLRRAPARRAASMQLGSG